MERCTSCQYFDRQSGRGSETKSPNAGQCRRSAPALSPINAKSYMIEGVWPTVRDDDWCGEWKALVRRVDPSRIADVLNGAGRPTQPSSGSIPLPQPQARTASLATLRPGTDGRATDVRGGDRRSTIDARVQAARPPESRPPADSRSIDANAAATLPPLGGLALGPGRAD